MRYLSPIVIFLLVVGTAYRLWPVVADMPAMANFFIIEDGYLLLTIARNMAVGLGMSVSEGTIATNGVQPLQTFIFAGAYVVTGGDKVDTLVWVHAIHALTALLSVFAIRALAARIFQPAFMSPVWPWAVALVWFLAPILVRHTMNGLETGLVTLVAVLTLLLFARLLDTGGAVGSRLGLGALCGVLVLARNDTVFLVAAIFVVWALDDLFRQRRAVREMLTRLIPPGLLSLLVAAPWLINNQIRFGSIVPISGSAQSLWTTVNENIRILPAKLFEHSVPMLPIPRSLEDHPVVIAISLAAIVVISASLVWHLARHAAPGARGAGVALFGHGAAIVTYYGFYFGAPHFLSRYTAPLAPLLILGSLLAALYLGRWLIRPRPELLAWAYTIAGVALSVLLLGRALWPGVTLQGHEQVIAWTGENIPPQVWVGAVQTGTLGYWHDRTINLDGKVNPAALAARKTEGHVLNYVLTSDIDYIIDWDGVGFWVDAPEAAAGFGAAFERRVHDPAKKLAVLARRIPVTPHN